MQPRALSGFGNDLWLTSSRHSQYSWFYSHLPTNQASIRFWAWAVEIESSCDTASSGCIGATKPKGNTPGLGSPWAANLGIVGKPIIIHGHHFALVLIPLSTNGHRTSGQGDLQSDPKQPLSQFSGNFHLCSSRGSEALQWRRGPQHQDVHCSAPHPASYNHTDPHTMRWGQN